MYDKKMYKYDVTSSSPLPCHKLSNFLGPLELEALYGRPLGTKRSTINNISCKPKSFQYRIETFG